MKFSKLLPKVVFFFRRKRWLIGGVVFIIVSMVIFLSDTEIYRKLRKQLRTTFSLQKTYVIKPVVLANDPIHKHRNEAQRHGIAYLQDDDHIEKYIRTGKLVKVRDNIGYRLHRLQYSSPVLVPQAYKVLKEIGRKFDDLTNGDYFVVTSLTRAEADQRKLRKNNTNATSNESTHSYGCSFDISYTRFNNERGYNPQLQNALERVLAEMKREGKILVIKERRIACYHITVTKH